MTTAAVKNNLNTVNEQQLVTWTGLALGESGDPITSPSHADRSVQVGGTFGGAVVTFKGSNDGITYHTLHDHFAVSHSYSAAGLLGLAELTRFVRPVVTGGDGTTSINVTLFIRRQAQ